MAHDSREFETTFIKCQTRIYSEENKEIVYLESLSSDEIMSHGMSPCNIIKCGLYLLSRRYHIDMF